jgi:hypothetical protein
MRRKPSMTGRRWVRPVAAKVPTPQSLGQSLALFGGQPVRTRTFPIWPVFGVEEGQRLLQALWGGQWGKLNGEKVAEFERRFAAMHSCTHGIAVVREGL